MKHQFQCAFYASGRGHFGTVYHGEFIRNEIDAEGNKVRQKVALKTLSRIEDMDAVEAFLREGDGFVVGRVKSSLNFQCSFMHFLMDSIAFAEVATIEKSLSVPV